MVANQPPPPSPSRWFLYVFVGVVAILAVIIIIGITLGSDDGDQTDASAECPTLNEERYLDRMGEILDEQNAEVDDVGALSGEVSVRPFLLYDREWQSKMIPHLRSLSDLAAEIPSVPSPASTQYIHDDLLLMSIHLRSFSEKYMAVLHGADANLLAEALSDLETVVSINNLSVLRLVSFCGG